MGHRIRLAGLGLGLAAIGALAVACTSSSGTSASPAPSATNALTAYTTCLQRNGVVLPSGIGRTGFPSGRPSVRPSGSPGAGRGGFGGGGGGFGGGGFGTQAPTGVDQATWDKAMQACASVRPTLGGGGGNNSAFVAYRNCLSEHGVTNAANQFNTADPKVAAALAACAPLRPTGPPRPTQTPTG